MSHAIDIKDVIQKTTSEVPLEQLQRRGFTKVKVLDRAAIKRMIAEAVNKVVEDRHQDLSESERDRLRSEAKEEFDNRLREFRVNESKQREDLKQELASREDRVDKLCEELKSDQGALELRESELQARATELDAREAELNELAKKAEAADSRLCEIEDMVAQIHRAEEELCAKEDSLREREIRVQMREETMEESTPSMAAAPSEEVISDLIRSALREVQTDQPAEAETDDLTEIKQSLQNLAASVARGGGGGGGGGSDIGDLTDAASIEALVERAGTTSGDIENNLERVEVKESVAKSVNANLAKLKNLKKGGA